jgi:hypothetical protein
MRVLIIAAALSIANAAISPHSWDTVSDVMGMHGKFNSYPSDESLGFAAKTYSGMATIGTGCSIKNTTMEDASLTAAKKMKAVNADANVGMYYRSDMALELAECSTHSDEWNAHPEYWLKDDKGNYIKEHGTTHMMDYSNQACADFFAGVYQSIFDVKLASGKPVIDYIYMDGAGCSKTAYQPGIGPARSAAICSGKLNMIATLQAKLNAAGEGQNLVLNGMDTPETAALFVPTGAAGAMFDHWTILQYLNRSNGDFLVDAMDAGFSFVQSKIVSNITVQIKGWPGPIVKQKDQYPANIPTPKTPAELQSVGSERFNSELAFFLLVAEDSFYWLYSWFWGWDDWVPGESGSSVPNGFFAQAKCQLGAPKGKGARVAGTWTYTREFEHATVFVDLMNRTASNVKFTGKC